MNLTVNLRGSNNQLSIIGNYVFNFDKINQILTNLHPMLIQKSIKTIFNKLLPKLKIIIAKQNSTKK